MKSVRFSDILLEKKPTAVIMDVEGLEIELLTCDLQGVHKIIVETHPKIVGAEKNDEMLTHLKSVGFQHAAHLRENAVFLR